MANEIKVNGNIEDALRKFKRQCARNGESKKYVKENTTKNQVLEERKNQRQLEKENFK